MPPFLWLLLLCLVEGSLWFLPTTQTSLATLSGLGGLVSGALWIAARHISALQPPRCSGEDRASALPWAAAGSVALPATLLSLAQPLVGGTMGATLLAATPTIAAFAVHLLTAQSEDLGQSMLPAMAGLAGALLLLPFHLPENPSGWVGFSLDLLAAACAGGFGAWWRSLSRSCASLVSFRELARGNAPAFLAGSVVIWATSRGAPNSAVPITAVNLLLLITTSAVTLGLSFWCLGRLEAVSFASRFLLIPLTVAVESWVVWRPGISVRAASGALLMAISVALAFRKRSPLPSTILPGTLG